jgi:membrane protease YdiL (CAAX protease family)
MVGNPEAMNYRTRHRRNSVRYNFRLATSRQIGPLAALGTWAAFCFGGGLYASWPGYGGREFAATLTTFAFYFAVLLLFAARGVPEFLASRFGAGGGYLLGMTVILGYLIYALGTNTFAFARAGAITALVFVPLALAASAEGQPPGAWQDYITIAGVWVAVKFSPSHWLWPYPGGRLAYVFTVLLCVCVALATFLLVRRFVGVAYNIGWGSAWSLYIAGNFLAFGAIAIPLGLRMHFIEFAPHWAAWKSLPFVTLAILCFTAWPEEFLFRGLLQNMLTRSSKSELAGWWTASVLFGFSHITNLGFPNWRYVILASIAGLFYGWTWRKTGSIFASAIVHALVDASWHFLFRTP